MNLSNYFVLFNNSRDANQVATLAQQMYPHKSKFVSEAFENATKQPYGYLFVDLKPETDERYQIRTSFFPDDRQYVYVPKV
jgi:alpha-mannosidase